MPLSTRSPLIGAEPRVRGARWRTFDRSLIACMALQRNTGWPETFWDAGGEKGNGARGVITKSLQQHDIQ
jgi:hypothetical protein